MTGNSDRPSPWRTAKQIANYLQCSDKTVYQAVAAGRLKAARIGGRRSLRFLEEWADAYLEASSTPVEVLPRRRA